VIGVGGPPLASRLDEIPEQAVFDAWCGLLDRLQADPIRSDRAAS
jgi:hypothetical protein